MKARIPAQAFDQMNENFFRTTFTSRAWDALCPFYSFETEYNTPAGRWVSSVKTAVIEVCGSRGWNWFDLFD